MRGRGGGAGGHGATAEERSTAEQVAAQVRKQGRSSPGVVSASESWTDEALRFLSRQKHPKRVKLAALNYANCSYIGGNYSDGGFVRAQEEELCRLCPALFHSMQSCPEAGCKSGYLRTEYRKHVFGARFNDGYSKARNVLFTGEVRCMRGPAEHSYRLLHQEANRVQAGFVEAAAPLFNRGHDQAFQKWRDDPAEWYEKVMLNVFWAPKSVDENYDVMVVGPWGCGAFGNSPDVVARSIFEVIEKHKLRYLYKEIHFCLGRRMQQDFTAGGACNANIQAFQKEFERRAESGQCVVEDYTEELQRRAGEWMQEER